MYGKKYIIYNSYAGKGKCKAAAEILELVYDDVIFIDMEKISNYKVFFNGLEKDDEVILCGGDGTLNRFVNAIRKIDIKNNLYFYSVGYGDNFVRDLGFEREQEPRFLINPYIKNLPVLTVNKKERLFVNGVGFGADSDCWALQENRFEKEGKFFQICCRFLKEVFLSYKPAKATICIDGKEMVYENVWMAPTMFGRVYNAGLMPVPAQNRMSEKKHISLMLLHGCSKWKAFFIYLSMYKGKHEKFDKYVNVFNGNEIKVRYDRSVSLVVDGDILNNISEYQVNI